MSGVAKGPTNVVLVVAHCAMRKLIVELLNRDHLQWVVSAIDSVSKLGDGAWPHPYLVVVDTADFAHFCRPLPARFPVDRIVVIGPEPDPAYRRAALHRGAGAWLSRDRIAEELCDALRSALAQQSSPAIHSNCEVRQP